MMQLVPFSSIAYRSNAVPVSPFFKGNFSRLCRMLFCLVGLTGAGVPSLLFSQSYSPVAVSGYNFDLVANGVGPASGSTTSDMWSTRAFVSSDFRATAGGAAPTYSLPTSGLILSAATSGLSFQMASYTGNNGLRMATQGQSGTLIFTTPRSAAALYLLATAGEYDATITIVVNFSDATTQTFTAQTIRDWYGGSTTNRVTSGIGRINVTNNGLEGDATNPHLYQLPLGIATANQSKLITSLTITKTDATVLNYPAVGGGVVGILAVSASTIPLPVTLTSFYGKKEKEGAKLFWATATEMNNKGFEVQRSSNGSRFSTIIFVASKAKDGNSSLPISYELTDRLPASGDSYYRLAQVDKDGKTTYSPIVFLKGIAQYQIQLSGLYPNPVSSTAMLHLEAPVAGKVTLLVTDAKGTAALRQTVAVAVGINTLSISTGALPAGNYYLQAIAADGKSNTIGFIIK